MRAGALQMDRGQMRLTLLAAIVLALAGGAGWMSGGADNLDAAAAPPAGWRLPDVQVPDISTALADLRRRQPFGASAAGEGSAGGIAEVAAALTRRVAAVVVRDSQPRLLMVAAPGGEGPAAEVKKLGDDVGGGWVIEEIGRTSVVLRQGDELQRIELFK